MNDYMGWSPSINIDADYEYTEALPPRQHKVSKAGEEGYECISCGDFYPFAELNSPEGDIHRQFKCYCCRKGLRGLFR